VTRAGGPHLSVPLLLALLNVPFQTYSSTNHLQAALRMINQGNLQQAEREARLALDDPESRPVAWAALGTIRLQQNKYDEGVEFLQKALSLNPRLVGARISLGGGYLLLGKRTEAREAFREALRAEPNNLNARFDLAQLESEDANYKVSLEVAKPVVDELQRSPDGLVLLATDYAGLQLKDSIQALLPPWKALGDPPIDLTVRFASLLIKNGLAPDAVEILEKAKAVNPASFQLTFALGSGYIAAGRVDPATESYEATLKLKGDCVPCLTEIARISEQQGNTEKALAYLIRAKRIEPENPEILFRLGRVCLERDLFDDAMDSLQKAAALRPDNDSFLYVLGSAQVAKRKYKEAETIFKTLLAKHPSDAVLNYALGSVLYLDENLDEAKKYLQKSVDLPPDQRAAHYYLGLIVERQDAEEASRIFSDLIQRYPDYAAPYVALGTLLVKQKRFPDAEKILKKAVQLDPDSVKAHYQLGMALGRMGKAEEAHQQMEIAQKLELEERNKDALQLHLLMPD